MTKLKQIRCKGCGTKWSIDLDGARPFKCPNCELTYKREGVMEEDKVIPQPLKSKGDDNG